MKRVVLPFTAIVGQEKLKQALLLNAVNPGLLGVLIRGEKGTGKSTAVRALADLLPEIDVVRCPFNCSPANPSLQCSVCNDKYLRAEDLPVAKRKVKVVELPLGATEDRVTGTLDIEKALIAGVKTLEPGILAEVNQGILYIDEVNLLDDHLVDILLDSAAMGINIIEREGISVSHPSRFILVGTMNPEEGEIRPQLLDRFGLSVEIRGVKDVQARVEIIRVVESFEKDPEAFATKYENAQEDLRNRILNARGLLVEVDISGGQLRTIADLCLEFEVHGHRADFLIARAAKTLAAYNQRKNVIEEDIRQAAELVLPHRMRRLPFEDPEPISKRIEAVLQRKTPSAEGKTDTQDYGKAEGHAEDDEEADACAQIEQPRAEDPSHPHGRRKAEIKINKDRKRRTGSGRRARTLSTHSGKYVKARISDDAARDIAIDATIRAVAARKGTLEIEKQDLREKVRAKKVSSVIVFVVDTSGSMAAMHGIEMAKSATMSLLHESYQKRDKVAFVAVAGEKASILLHPTSSVELAVRHLKALPTEGRTPLSDGLYKGIEILKTQLWKNRNVIPVMVLVSDGRGNVPLATDVREELVFLAGEIKRRGINMVVIDSDDDFLNLGYNKEIVEASGAKHFRLHELDSRRVVDAVKAVGNNE
ncbi:MAG: magnesium chelatase subunit D family protein [Dehalococcoidia bacterium]|nr:magnesium chelatase subunit D family protein [Dehalococcoidia bacterium]